MAGYIPMTPTGATNVTIHEGVVESAFLAGNDFQYTAMKNITLNQAADDVITTGAANDLFLAGNDFQYTATKNIKNITLNQAADDVITTGAANDLFWLVMIFNTQLRRILRISR